MKQSCFHGIPVLKMRSYFCPWSAMLVFLARSFKSYKTKLVKQCLDIKWTSWRLYFATRLSLILTNFKLYYTLCRFTETYWSHNQTIRNFSGHLTSPHRSHVLTATKSLKKNSASTLQIRCFIMRINYKKTNNYERKLS